MSLKWLTQSKAKGKFLDDTKFLLKDAKFEKQFGFVLKESIAKAPLPDLFQGKSVYTTTSVKPPSSDLTPILQACNSKVLSSYLACPKANCVF